MVRDQKLALAAIKRPHSPAGNILPVPVFPRPGVGETAEKTKRNLYQHFGEVQDRQMDNETSAE